jgi:hypothetical protein
MLWRRFLLFLPFAGLVHGGGASVRGKLMTGPKPVVRTPAGEVSLQGDEPTMAVLADDRLKSLDFEALGSPVPPGSFRIEPIHTRSLFVIRDGKRLMITYWCDVCYIRTYSPGKCWCCQKDTDLDPRESISD